MGSVSKSGDKNGSRFLSEFLFVFFFQAEDGIRDIGVTGVQTCALPISVAEVGVAGRGFEGDFEFRVLSAAADSVVLEGKKHGARIVMTPMPAETKWVEDRKSVV